MAHPALARQKRTDLLRKVGQKIYPIRLRAGLAVLVGCFGPLACLTCKKIKKKLKNKKNHLIFCKNWKKYNWPDGSALALYQSTELAGQTGWNLNLAHPKMRIRRARSVFPPTSFKLVLNPTSWFDLGFQNMEYIQFDFYIHTH